MKIFDQWWPFPPKSESDVTVTIDPSASPVDIAHVASDVSSVGEVDEVEVEHETLVRRSKLAYERDLSLGGAVMVGLGAKRLLLPTLLVGHPILFTVTASTTVATGFYYMHRFWNGMVGNEKLSGEAISGTVGIATLALGSGGVPALTSIWLLNLGGYLKTRAIKNMPPEEQLAEEQVKMQAATERVGKLFHLASWGMIGAGVGSYVAQHRVQLASMTVLSNVIQYVSTSPYGPLMYIAFYAIQPPFFFSEMILTTSAGFLFGPVWGMVYATVGGNAEAMYSYMLGRYFGPRILDTLNGTDMVERYGQPLKKNPFETILTMRLLMMPHDIVSCLAGTLQVDWKPFLVATALGSIPTTTSLVLFGSSVTASGLGAVPQINRSVLAASGAIFVGSMAVSRYLKRQAQENETEEEEREIEAGTRIEIESPTPELPDNLIYLGGA